LSFITENLLLSKLPPIQAADVVHSLQIRWNMKVTLVCVSMLVSISSISQQDSLFIYWNDLAEQFLYRADVAKKFAAAAEASKFVDYAYINGINETNKRLNQKLTNQHFIDSLLIKEVTSENEQLIRFLGRVIVQLENDKTFSSTEEFKNFRTLLMSAENRIRAKQKMYNEFCQRSTRKDLFYKKKD